MFLYKRVTTTLLSLLLCSVSLTVTAQTTQSANSTKILSGKTIRLLIGFPAGGTSDSIGRSIAEKIGPLKTSLVLTAISPPLKLPAQHPMA